MAVAGRAVGEAARAPAYGIPFVIGASSAGTVIEWYDFYLYALLTPFLAPLFFPSDNPTASLLAGFAVYGAGFAVRPFGALVFGRIGDVIGRKYAFLLTVSIMGGATTLVGLLPTYAQIGIFGPAILVTLRLLQGLALGGEYGGAAIYVAEHAPDGKRGLYTSWIQTTATVGMFAALGVILATRLWFGDDAYRAGGWRIPFLLSAILVVGALYIRRRLQETPIFQAIKARGETAKDTAGWAKESFSGNKVWVILLVLIGMTAGQAVVWYQGQFQALFFLTVYLKSSYVPAYTVLIVAIALATPFFVVFGWLSDKIGRKPVILGGCLIAALTYVPIYQAMIANANVVYDSAGKIVSANPTIPIMIALVWIQIVYVTMVYGPIAAFLVEFFPTQARYTSLSIPYHLGNGEFGGWLPTIYLGLVAATVAGAGYIPFLGVFDLRFLNPSGDPNGNILAGLIYTIGVALITTVVGWLFIPETKDRRIWDEVQAQESVRGLKAGDLGALSG
ncbi:MAG TPA: MFS transporter [Chloroflexota bacterium]|jgi:MFS family permease|nr:MFS transporter [Chloroflexota bacterium]